MALSVKDIAWVAGLLEADGCFQARNGHNPTIQLVMTDPDTVVKFARIVNSWCAVQQKARTSAGRPIYRSNLYGKQAMSWMMTIYPLMSLRRKAKIRELLEIWKNKPRKGYPERTRPTLRGGSRVLWSRSGG